MRFDLFVAVDWSGARRPQRDAIAVALCRPGNDAPVLVEAPSGQGWSRMAAAAWLQEAMSGDEAVLVGLDFAFAFPWQEGLGYLTADVGPQPGTPFALWDYVEGVCAGDADLFAGAFVAVPGLAPLFWSDGARPHGFEERRRETERRCAEAGLGRPESIFELIGPKQVGKGSLAGMRLLARLKARLGTAVKVWPFEEAAPGDSVCVEIFPTLFRPGVDKIRDSGSLDEALARLGSAPARFAHGRLSDDAADALVSAAALRHLAAEPERWHPTGMTEAARRREGWIFGVR